MVICFNASVEAKKALDTLLASAQFQDSSEVISMALVNYQVIHQKVLKDGLVLGDSLSKYQVSESRHSGSEAASTSTKPVAGEPHVTPAAVGGRNGVPDLFRLGDTGLEGLDLLPVVPPGTGAESNLPPARWLFGQYNKLLPVKATCRALLNLQRQKPGGVTLPGVASEIASAACGLGDFLKSLDERHQLRREDALSAAFPSSASGSEGSRLRFANQFVAGLRRGRLEGLPAALRLVALDQGKEPRLCLTRAGAEFAVLANPILDECGEASPRKLSGAEIEYLLTHIRQHVPEEASAYAAIVQAIQSGSNSPDELDVYLRQRFSLPDDTDMAGTFLTTQRTGAISRMVDLDLIGRKRDGLRVSYVLAPGTALLKEKVSEL
jgi:hypothetical protein